MPAPPELAHAAGDIRVVEVFRKLEAEEHADADGHVAPAGEIEENLETSSPPEPRKPHAELLRREGVYALATAAALSASRSFFKRPRTRRRRPAAVISGRSVLRELRRGILPADDRPRDQAGKNARYRKSVSALRQTRGWFAIHPRDRKCRGT